MASQDIVGAKMQSKDTSREEIKMCEYVLKHAKRNDCDSVIDSVDEYCWNNQYVMNLSEEKGKLLDNIMKEYKPKNILVLSKNCGYSSIRMARFLPQDGKIFSIDQYHDSNCDEIIDYSGLSWKIKCYNGYGGNIIPQLIDLQNKIDVVFINYDDSQYLGDLMMIEDLKLLHSNSIIIANNVNNINMEEYLKHVGNSDLYIKSQNYKFILEGNRELEDGLEVSIWKGSDHTKQTGCIIN